MPSQIKVDEIKNVAGQYEIKTDTFKGQTTAGSIAVQGEGTATTNLQQGLIKVWMRWDMAASSLEGSFNVSGFTDVSTGISQFNYTSNLADGNYAIAGVAGEKSGGGNRGLGVNGNSSVPTAALIRFYSFTSSWGAADLDVNGANISGDLA